MSDDFDPLLEDEELLPKKKRGGSSDGLASDDELDEFSDEFALDDLDEDPFMSDLGYGFGGDDDELL